MTEPVLRREERLLYIRLTDGGSAATPRYHIQVHSTVDVRPLSKTLPFTLPDLQQSQRAQAGLQTAVNSHIAAQLTDASPAFREITVVGEELYRALTADPEIANYLREVLAIANARDWNLFCLIQCDSEELARLFWGALNRTSGEYRSFFFTDNKAVALHVPLGHYWLGPHAAPTETVRIGFVSSSFNQEGNRERWLDDKISQEQRCLEQAWKKFTPKQVTINVLSDPTLGQLQRFLAHVKPHVLHYYGHGFDHDGDECIVLADGENGALRMPWSTLTEIFNKECTAHLRLIVLNACHLNHRAQVGQKLVGLGVPAVVAMRATIHSDTVTDEFTPEFYKALAEGQYIHEAFRRAQSAIRYRTYRAVEAFVPTLVHGSLTGIPLLDLSRPDFREAFEAAERRRLDGEQLAEQLRVAYDAAGTHWRNPLFRSAVQAAAAAREEPPVARALQEVSLDMAQRIDERATDGDWPTAFALCAAAAEVQEALEPQAGRLKEVLDRVRVGVKPHLANLERRMDDLFRHKDWTKFLVAAEQYLELVPEAPDTRSRVRAARGYAELESQIVVEEASSGVAKTFREIVNLIGNQKFERARQQYSKIERDLRPSQRAEFEELLQAGMLHEHRQRLAEARASIATAMTQDRWADAEQECLALRKNLARGTPEWLEVVQYHGEVREARARHADRQRQWKHLLEVAREVRNDGDMGWLYASADEWRGRALHLLELTQQIVVDRSNRNP